MGWYDSHPHYIFSFQNPDHKTSVGHYFDLKPPGDFEVKRSNLHLPFKLRLTFLATLWEPLRKRRLLAQCLAQSGKTDIDLSIADSLPPEMDLIQRFWCASRCQWNRRYAIRILNLIIFVVILFSQVFHESYSRRNLSVEPIAHSSAPILTSNLSADLRPFAI